MGGMLGDPFEAPGGGDQKCRPGLVSGFHPSLARNRTLRTRPCEATDRLDALGTQIDLGLALLDLGREERRAGEDATPAFERSSGTGVEVIEP